MVDIKSKVDIEKMRVAGKLASEVFRNDRAICKTWSIYGRT